jgi:hypothetical protein
MVGKEFRQEKYLKWIPEEETQNTGKNKVCFDNIF